MKCCYFFFHLLQLPFDFGYSFFIFYNHVIIGFWILRFKLFSVKWGSEIIKLERRKIEGGKQKYL